MSEQSNQLITDGKVELMGMNISISDVIAEKLVNQYIAQLSPERIKLIFDAIDKEAFSKEFDYESKEEKEYFATTRDVKDRWGHTETETTPIWEEAQRLLRKRYSEIIMGLVDEILQSDKLKQKAEEIANEIVEYAANGYKEDLKKRIYDRFVDATALYNDRYYQVNIRSAIQEEINIALNNRGY